MTSFDVLRLNEGTLMTCKEAGCEDFEHGWVGVYDERSDLGARQAHYIRRESGRHFRELRSEEVPELLPELLQLLPALAPGLTVFMFAPGQRCFRQHLDREVKFFKRTALGAREHDLPRDWQEDFNETAYQAQRLVERG